MDKWEKQHCIAMRNITMVQAVFWAWMESGLYPVFTEDGVERIFSMYEERKKSAQPLHAADGSLIRPDGYDDILYSREMLEYFEKNVYGKGEYENPLGQPVQLFYDSWLEETYGKTEKLKRYLDEVAEMMRNACRSGPEYRLCLNGGGYYLDEGTELFFKIVDDTGESVSYTRRIGRALA